MALLVPDVGEDRCLKAVLNHTPPQDLLIKLFTNNWTPTEADIAGTYNEASGFGYVAKTLTGSSWTISGTAPTAATYAQQTWTFTGALGQVFGYYVVQAISGVLMWAERFSDGPYPVNNNGDQVLIAPRIELS